MDAPIPTEEPHGTRDASRVARAGGGAFVVLVASRGVRTLATWVLSIGLGPAGFGVYTLATTVVSLLGLVAPVGLIHGATLFGSRHRAAGDLPRLKGVLLAAIGLSGLVGASLSALVVVGAPWAAGWFEEPALVGLLGLAAPAVLLLGWLGVLAGALRAAKDVRGEVLVTEAILPAVLLAGSAGAVLFGSGTTGAVEAFVIAHAVGVVLAWRRLRRAYPDVIGVSDVRPRIEWGPLLRFSLPQTLVDVLHKALLWSDLILLGVLATTSDVGRYRVAVALAVAGALPAGAATRMFDPLAAEIIQRGELARLHDLLQAVTRWLAIAVMPLYVVLLVVPDLVLGLFGAEYAAAAPAVGILLVGQFLFVVCAPSNSAIQMAGHSVPNVVNGALALVLNLALNLWLIPLHGAVGAAVASAIAFTTWSVLRVAEAWWFLGTFPFTVRSAVLPAALLGGAAALGAASADWGTAARIGVAAGALAVAGAASWFGVATAADRALVRPQP